MNYRYWIYAGVAGVATIHRSDCGHCDDAGMSAGQIKEWWYGFYATRGAALDAARTLGGARVNWDRCMDWNTG